MEKFRIERRNQSAPQQGARTCSRVGDSGSRISMASLYLQAKPQLFFYAYRITRSRDTAEEIVQDVFTYAWLNTEAYDQGKAKLLTWLLMLCRSRAIDYLRSQKIHPLKELGAADWEAIEGDGPGPEAACVEGLRKRALQAGLKALPACQRKILVLNYYSELSHTEIASFMDMPVGTVKTIIRRAKLSLATQAALQI